MPARAEFTAASDAGQVRWQPAEVTSPLLDRPVPVVAARDIPYISHANRFQNLSIYLPRTPESAELVYTPVTSLPGADCPSRLHTDPAREAVHPQHVSDALLGLNGLYDLPALATAEGLGTSHAHLRDDYERLVSGAFGTDQDT